MFTGQTFILCWRKGILKVSNETQFPSRWSWQLQVVFNFDPACWLPCVRQMLSAVTLDTTNVIYGLNLTEQVRYPDIRDPFLNPCPMNPALKQSLASGFYAQFLAVHFPGLFQIQESSIHYWTPKVMPASLSAQKNFCAFSVEHNRPFRKWFRQNINTPYMWSARIRSSQGYLKRLQNH